MMYPKIAVTGANGFIGSYLISLIQKKGIKVRGVIRSHNTSIAKSNKNVSFIGVGNIDGRTNWKHALRDIDCVIHCAGRAHKMNDSLPKNYLEVNTEGTRRLALEAVKAGVKRVVFLSTIKVNGDSTDLVKPFSNNSSRFYDTNPSIIDDENFYEFSKWLAENELWEISKQSGIEIVILRIPLVYGPGVKGNLEKLYKLIKLNLPLPFGRINNSRSMIGIANLADLIITCSYHKNATNKTFLASDGEDISTPELINLISLSMMINTRMINIPISLLRGIFYVVGRNDIFYRLSNSLRVDNSYTMRTLNWKPSVNLQEGIKEMVESFD